MIRPAAWMCVIFCPDVRHCLPGCASLRLCVIGPLPECASLFARMWHPVNKKNRRRGLKRYPVQPKAHAPMAILRLVAPCGLRCYRARWHCSASPKCQAPYATCPRGRAVPGGLVYMPLPPFHFTKLHQAFSGTLVKQHRPQLFLHWPSCTCPFCPLQQAIENSC